jgi:hypothetical protein
MKPTNPFGPLLVGLALGVMVVLVSQIRPFHRADPQVATGSWIIDINVPPCTGKVVNSGSSPDGGPLELSCETMPVSTK